MKFLFKVLVFEMEDEDEEDDFEDVINEFDFLGLGEDGEGVLDFWWCIVDGSFYELESCWVKF